MNHDSTATTPLSIALHRVRLRQRVPDACVRYSRVLRDVTLIAVSKFQARSVISASLSGGQQDFGENCIQGISEKWGSKDVLDDGVRLHFLGRFQRNKVATTARYCDVVHSVDSARLATDVAAVARKHERTLGCSVQVNTGRESQKSGTNSEGLQGLLDRCRSERGLDVIRLMRLPPVGDSPQIHFDLLLELAESYDLH